VQPYNGNNIIIFSSHQKLYIQVGQLKLCRITLMSYVDLTQTSKSMVGLTKAYNHSNSFLTNNIRLLSYNTNLWFQLQIDVFPIGYSVPHILPAKTWSSSELWSVRQSRAHSLLPQHTRANPPSTLGHAHLFANRPEPDRNNYLERAPTARQGANRRRRF
jgi:hypothetical protein